MNRDLYGKAGFLYVLTSASMPGLCKIGVTRVHPLQRAVQLSIASGVPTPFKLAYFRDFEDSFAAETAVHEKLEGYRINESREFFKIELSDAIVAIDRLAIKLTSQGVTGGEAPRDQRANPKGWSSDDVDLSWALLFASFNPDGPPELDSSERARCRGLEARIKSGNHQPITYDPRQTEEPPTVL